MNIDNFIKVLTQNTRSTFATIHNYVNSDGEVSDYNLVLNSDYASLVKRSIAKLEKFAPKTKDEKQAKEKIAKSLQKSLNSVADNFAQVTTKDGKVVKGLKQNRGKFYITGILVNKRKFNDNKSKTKQLTCEQKIFNTLPISRFRQFKLSPDKNLKIAVNGKSIKIC
ncbi:MAG: hypothetical protein LC122_12380 [Chitinophagales bacterium]|nr:hypothetical protein [Chitinophagales bacterium]